MGTAVRPLEADLLFMKCSSLDPEILQARPWHNIGGDTPSTSLCQRSGEKHCGPSLLSPQRKLSSHSLTSTRKLCSSSILGSHTGTRVDHTDTAIPNKLLCIQHGLYPLDLMIHALHGL